MTDRDQVQPDVLVVGGGVVGLATAYYLSERGDLRVTLLERGECGRSASWAAAGMLAAQVEVERPGPLLTLALAGRSLYDRLAVELYEETGIEIGLRRPGIVRPALSDDEQKSLTEQLHRQQALGFKAEWLDPEQVRKLVPVIAPGVQGGLFLPEEGRVNNRNLVQALVAGCLRRGVQILERTEVTGWLTRPGKRGDEPGESSGEVLGVNTVAGPLFAGSVVLAGGAWSAHLAQELGLRLPVFPVKGQIVELRALDPPVGPILFHERECYVVPQSDGRLLVGATQEKAGFADQPTVGGLAALMQRALRLAPGLAEAELVGTRSGLRPGCPDGQPILGPAPAWRRLYLATAHFRNGILMGPISGLTIAMLIRGEPVPVNWRPFGLARFAVTYQ
ncbi:MAG: glycine oxidase ThiO [Firmicutes bacterium]|nr:glycine oxidase ThiO [Bacillota bacterium]